MEVETSFEPETKLELGGTLEDEMAIVNALECFENEHDSS